MQKSYTENRTAKVSRITLFRVLVVLLCVTLISSHTVMGIWANYSSRDYEVDSAKVAVFKVDAEGNSTDGLQQSIKSDT